MSNRLRIIGGRWRSRVIVFPDAPGLRPTPNRVRETLFNWLQFDLDGARCLDLYAGSGALGFEALSRGAASLTQVDSHPAACQALRDNGRLLGACHAVVRADARAFLAGSATPYDLVFLDPPFGQGLAAACCALLEQRGWLAPAAMIYVEAEQGLALDGLPVNWTLLRGKTAGEVGYHLFQRQPDTGGHDSENAPP